jgi:hypothetical protein
VAVLDVRIVDDLLTEAESAWRDDAWDRDPWSTPESAPSRAEHFADAVRFALERPAAVRRLHLATSRLVGVSSLSAAVAATLTGAMDLVHADLGVLQLVDPGLPALRLVAHHGFDDHVTGRFARADDLTTACGRAARTGQQIAIADVDADEAFAPHREWAAACGFRSVESTPVRDYSGQLLGVVSTHHSDVGSPAVESLRLLELYADYAGESLAALLAPRRAENDDPGPVARAMIDALLDPPSPLPDAVNGAIRVPPPRSGPFSTVVPDERIATLADLVVTGLFTAELQLDSARSMAPPGPVATRIAAASAALERVVAQLRQSLLSGESGRSGDGGPDSR